MTADAPSTGARERWPLLLVTVGILVLAAPTAAEVEAEWDAVNATTLVSDVGRPVDLAITDEGVLWWTAHDEGNVTRYDPATDERDVVHHVEPTPDLAERGLIGLAHDPAFADNGVFYIYYTVADPDEEDSGTNYLARIEDGEETRLLSVPANGWHNGGKIVFDDEGRMFVSTGDNERGWEAQDPGSRLGSILHLQPDGTAAEDTIEGYVYSIGHRNVYGLAYDEETDRLFATENNDRERDEINIVDAGNNYGWPYCEGYHRFHYENRTPTDRPCEDPKFTAPIGVFHDNETVAPTGATMFAGDLYWGALKDRGVHRMAEDLANGTWEDTLVFGANDEIYDLASHDGSLYYAARGEIVRLDVPLVETDETDAIDESNEAGDVDQAPSGGLLSEIPARATVAVAGFAVAGLAAQGRRA